MIYICLNDLLRGNESSPQPANRTGQDTQRQANRARKHHIVDLIKCKCTRRLHLSPCEMRDR